MTETDLYSRLNTLTHRQLQIVKAVLDTGSTLDAARRLGCTQGNIKQHLTAVYKALDIKIEKKSGLPRLFLLLLEAKPRESTRRIFQDRLKTPPPVDDLLS